MPVLAEVARGRELQAVELVALIARTYSNAALELDSKKFDSLGDLCKSLLDPYPWLEDVVRRVEGVGLSIAV